MEATKETLKKLKHLPLFLFSYLRAIFSPPPVFVSAVCCCSVILLLFGSASRRAVSKLVIRSRVLMVLGADFSLLRLHAFNVLSVKMKIAA